MATLTIKGIPDELYQQLKERATAERRSLNSEVIVCLERAVGTRRPSVEEHLERARASRERAGSHVIALETIQAAKSEGRP